MSNLLPQVTHSSTIDASKMPPHNQHMFQKCPPKTLTHWSQDDPVHSPLCCGCAKDTKQSLGSAQTWYKLHQGTTQSNRQGITPDWLVCGDDFSSPIPWITHTLFGYRLGVATLIRRPISSPTLKLLTPGHLTSVPNCASNMTNHPSWLLCIATPYPCPWCPLWWPHSHPSSLLYLQCLPTPKATLRCVRTPDSANPFLFLHIPHLATVSLYTLLMTCQRLLLGTCLLSLPRIVVTT